MRLFPIVAGGQLISVLLALTAFISTNLTERGFNFPVLQSTGFYLLLSLFLLTLPFPIKMPIYLYGLLALLDVEANYLAVMAYQYTDITSVLLLNSLTIPWVALLSYYFLNKRYNVTQIVAIVVCIGGLGMVIASDTLRDRWGNSSTPSAWIGDLICVGSSLLYAMQNVLQEYMLKRLASATVGSDREYFGMLGLFGFLFSNIQWLVIERFYVVKAGSSIWTSEVIGLFVGFSFVMLTLYILLGWFIGKYDASLFNMGILTSGIYGVVFEFAQKKSTPRPTSDWMYIIAYALVVSGVVTYSINERKVNATISGSISKLRSPLTTHKSDPGNQIGNFKLDRV